MNKKKVITILAAACLVAVYVLIFFFSAEDAEHSSKLSRAVADFIKHIYYSVISSGKPVQGVLPQEAVSFEAIVRKAAHFLEYFCMGFLSYLLILLWYPKLWKGRVLVGIQLLISASADEIHQYFIPGRYCALRDVGIDVAGGIAGMILLYTFYLLLHHKRQRKRLCVSKS